MFIANSKSACAIYLINLSLDERKVLLRGKAGFSKAERRSLTTNSKFSQKSAALQRNSLALCIVSIFRSFLEEVSDK